jgi:hypothetical protein
MSIKTTPVVTGLLVKTLILVTANILDIRVNIELTSNESRHLRNILAQHDGRERANLPDLSSTVRAP